MERRLETLKIEERLLKEHGCELYEKTVEEIERIKEKLSLLNWTIDEEQLVA